MKTGVILSCIIVLFSDAAQAVVYDNFNHPQWLSFNSPGMSIVEHNERLEISFSENATGDIFTAGYASTCMLFGDFDIRAAYATPVYPKNNGVRVGLLIDPAEQTAGETYTSAVMERVTDPDGVSYYGADFSNYPPQHPAFVDTTDRSGYFRLTRVGSTLTAWFWNKTAKRYVAVNSTQAFTTDPVYFQLTSWSHDGYFAGKPVAVTFDNVTINRGVCKPAQ